MKKLVFLVGVLLLSAGTGWAAPNVTTNVKAPCQGVEFVQGHSNAFPDGWTIIVLCDRADFEKAAKSWKAPFNLGGFTVLEAKRTYILYDLRKPGTELWAHVADALDHELKHVLCNCTLGEH